MGDLETLENQEERLAQREQDRIDREREAEAARLREFVTSDPVSSIAMLPRRRQEVALSKIRLPDDTVGRRASLDDIPELAGALREFGDLQSMAVRLPVDGEDFGDAEVELVLGERRLASYRLAFKDDPDHVVEVVAIEGLTAAEARLSRAVVHIHQRQRSDVETARDLMAMMAELGETSVDRLARQLKLSPDKMYRTIRLIKSDVPPELLDALQSGDLSFRAAEMIRRAQEAGKITTATAKEVAADIAAGKKTVAEAGKEIGQEPPDAGKTTKPEIKFSGQTPPPPDGYAERSAALDAARAPAPDGNRLSEAKAERELRAEEAGDPVTESEDAASTAAGTPASSVANDDAAGKSAAASPTSAKDTPPAEAKVGKRPVKGARDIDISDEEGLTDRRLLAYLVAGLISGDLPPAGPEFLRANGLDEDADAETVQKWIDRWNEDVLRDLMLNLASHLISRDAERMPVAA